MTVSDQEIDEFRDEFAKMTKGIIGHTPMGRITKSGPADVYRIVAKRDLISGWAVLMWDDQGVVTLHTDHGSWVHQWHPSHIGSGSIPSFLAQINSSYAGSKFMGLRFKVVDVEKTVRDVKEHIIQERRNHRDHCGGYTDVEARDIWDGIADITETWELDEWLHSDPFCDAHEHLRHKPDPQWSSMWDRLWLPLLRPELAKIGKALAQSSEVADG